MAPRFVDADYIATKIRSHKAINSELYAKMVEEAPEEDVVKVLPCPDDCVYKGKRHQKCTCCSRNRYLKDCYIRR